MARVQLLGGAYQASSLIASAQKCINLYPETMPGSEGEPSRVTHYPTPGLILRHTFANGGPVRGLYTASNGDSYAVAGNAVYFFANVGAAFYDIPICRLTTSTGQVSFADNTITLFIVDGTRPSTDGASYGGGVQIDLVSKVPSFLPSASSGYLGADRVTYLETYLVFNEHATPNFYVSGSLTSTFNPLDFAAKGGASDYLVSVEACRGQLWLLGQNTSEVWTVSGAADFPFQALQGVLIEHGCIAVQSIAKADGAIFFLSRDKQGRCVVLKTEGLTAVRISTHAIENLIIDDISVDAVGYCYQLKGHVFYVISFPTADATFVYDVAEKLWHQWATFDSFGVPHRHRSNCYVYTAQDVYLVGDYQNGNLYELSHNEFTDNGAPITRIRSFPHMIDDDQRIAYKRFVADIDVATSAIGGLLTLRWSDDRGATWGNPLTASFGTLGQTYLSLQFRRLGMARDRVFQVSWDIAAPVALNGAFIDVEAAAS